MNNEEVKSPALRDFFYAFPAASQGRGIAPATGFCHKRKKQVKMAQTQQQSQKSGLGFFKKIKIEIEETGEKQSKNEKNEDWKLPIKILQKTY